MSALILPATSAAMPVIAHTKNADTETNPKKQLERLFEQHDVPFGPQPIQGAYQPKLAAIRMAEKIPCNFGQLGKVASFRKFGQSLTKAC